MFLKLMGALVKVEAKAAGEDPSLKDCGLKWGRHPG